jgi:hypothetical protein
MSSTVGPLACVWRALSVRRPGTLLALRKQADPRWHPTSITRIGTGEASGIFESDLEALACRRHVGGGARPGSPRSRVQRVHRVQRAAVAA